VHIARAMYEHAELTASYACHYGTAVQGAAGKRNGAFHLSTVVRAEVAPLPLGQPIQTPSEACIYVEAGSRAA